MKGTLLLLNREHTMSECKKCKRPIRGEPREIKDVLGEYGSVPYAVGGVFHNIAGRYHRHCLQHVLKFEIISTFAKNEPGDLAGAAKQLMKAES